MVSVLQSIGAGMVEGALRSVLASDAGAREELLALGPAAVRLRMERPPVVLTLLITPTQIEVDASETGEADVCVHTTPPGLLEVLTGGAEAALLSGAVRLEGNQDLARALLETLARLRPDLETPLRALVGSEGAAAAGAIARRGESALRDAAGQSAQRSQDWLTSGDGPLPSRPETERFLDEVDDLNLATDRLEARIAQLETSRAQATNAEPGS